MAVVGAIAAGALILPELTRPIRPSVAAGASRELTLIQFNAWDENADVASTADWIVAQKPDVVVMQEVHPPIRDAMIRHGFQFQRGLAHTGLFLRLAPEPAPFMVPKDAWKKLPDFARATFPADGGAFTVIAVHLVWPTRPFQRSTMTALLELLRRYPADRLIVTGDFNLTPWAFTLRDFDRGLGLERRDRALFSWPARLTPTARRSWPAPLLPIDHVYAGRAWRTISITRGPRLGSDHYPLLVRLALAG
jgi:endonuclease/exonuclease/phosphatase (EEP) superfamily protein YafD